MKIKYYGGKEKSFEIRHFEELEHEMFWFVREVLLANGLIDDSQLREEDSVCYCGEDNEEDIISYSEVIESKTQFNEIKAVYLQAKKDFKSPQKVLKFYQNRILKTMNEFENCKNDISYYSLDEIAIISKIYSKKIYRLTQTVINFNKLYKI